MKNEDNKVELKQKDMTWKTFLKILALILITLKLTNIINYSWWIILLPIYGIAASYIGLIILMIAGAFGFVLFDDIRVKIKYKIFKIKSKLKHKKKKEEQKTKKMEDDIPHVEAEIVGIDEN